MRIASLSDHGSNFTVGYASSGHLGPGGAGRGAAATMVGVTRKRWLLLGVAAWGVLLVVLAFTAHGKPTVAQQQSPAAARGSVNHAVLKVLAAARGAGVATVGSYHQVGRCDLSVDRGGVEYRRTVHVYGSSGGLLHRITGQLPTSYRARHAPTLDAENPVTVAHPGPFLKLTARMAPHDPGHAVVTVDTGCRPTTADPFPRFLPAPTSAERAPIMRVFSQLDVSPGHWRRFSVGCGSDGEVTVTATGRARQSLGPLGSLLGSGAGKMPGTAVARGDDRYVYRDGAGSGTDLVIGADADKLTVSTVSTC